MIRPANPYMKGSLAFMLMEGGLQGEFDGLPGWDDLTIAQIAEVLGASYRTVTALLSEIKKRTGYEVPRVRGRAGRKPEV